MAPLASGRRGPPAALAQPLPISDSDDDLLLTDCVPLTDCMRRAGAIAKRTSGAHRGRCRKARTRARQYLEWLFACIELQLHWVLPQVDLAYWPPVPPTGQVHRQGPPRTDGKFSGCKREKRKKAKGSALSYLPWLYARCARPWPASTVAWPPAAPAYPLRRRPGQVAQRRHSPTSPSAEGDEEAITVAHITVPTDLLLARCVWV